MRVNYSKDGPAELTVTLPAELARHLISYRDTLERRYQDIDPVHLWADPQPERTVDEIVGDAIACELDRLCVDYHTRDGKYLDTEVAEYVAAWGRNGGADPDFASRVTA